MKNHRLAIAAGVLVGLVLVWAAYQEPAPPTPAQNVAVPSRPAASTSAPAPREEAAKDADAAEVDAQEVEADAEVARAGVDPVADITAQLAQWDEDDIIHATCRLEPALPSARGYLAIGGHSDLSGRAVLVLGGVAHLPVLDVSEWTDGLLSIEGYAPVSVSWSLPGEDGEPGKCLREPVVLAAGGTVITGTVTYEGTGEPDPEAWVEGCGNLGRTDDDGVYYMEVVSEPCTLVAMRQDGMLRSVSPLEEVVPQPGEDLVVDLVLPAQRRAGLGVQIREVEEGVLIEGLIDGGSAAQAGLVEGDLIVAVEGDPVTEMDLGEFVDRVGGLAGTEVTLTLVDEREVVVERVELNSEG